MKRMCVWSILLFCSTILWASDSSDAMPVGRLSVEIDSFQSLDADVELVLDGILSLGADMLILQEAAEMSPKNQLMVLVSITPMPFFRLEAIQLLIDKDTAIYHRYTSEELEAMGRGGSHRLYLDDVPAGRHEVTAVMFGRVPKDPGYQREASQVIISGLGRKVLELDISIEKKQTFPDIEFKEWK